MISKSLRSRSSISSRSRSATTARSISADRLRSSRTFGPQSILPPQFMHGHEWESAGLRHVLEAAADRIVAADRIPIDAESGIDRRLDILRVNVTLLRPAEIGN